jgi:hypothetical protein
MRDWAILLFGAAYASDSFTGSTITNAADGTTTVLFKNPTTTPETDIWTMHSQTFYDLDTGYRVLRLTHTLYANIAATDKVTFMVSFTSDVDPWSDAMNFLFEDAGECVATINPDDDRFWTTTADDYYWVCQTLGCSLTGSGSYGWRSGSYTSSSDTINNWVIGVTDDDPRDPFCTPMAPVSVADPDAPTNAEY